MEKNFDSQDQGAFDMKELAAQLLDGYQTDIFDVSDSELYHTEIFERLKKEIIDYAKDPQSVKPTSRSYLIYGPSGVGKSPLIKALGNEATKNNIFCYYQHSMEYCRLFKMTGTIEPIFQVAYEKKPTILVADNLEFMSDIKTAEVQEATKRLIDEIKRLNKSDVPVIFVGLTNAPFRAEKALIESFQTKIYMPMPDEKLIRHLLNSQLAKTSCKIEESDVEKFAKKAQGYTISELMEVIEGAIMMNSRRSAKSEYFKIVDNSNKNKPIYKACSPSDPEAIKIKPSEDQIQNDPLSIGILDKALANVIPFVSDYDAVDFEEFRRSIENN